MTSSSEVSPKQITPDAGTSKISKAKMFSSLPISIVDIDKYENVGIMMYNTSI